MSLSLLLDENLSEKLLPLLFDRFPDSRHVRLIGLGGADDLAIWDRARLDGDLLVTAERIWFVPEWRSAGGCTKRCPGILKAFSGALQPHGLLAMAQPWVSGQKHVLA